MRISVNLATKRFVELRPLFARLRLAMGVLALLAVALGFLLHGMNAKAAAAAARMDALKAKTARFQQERASNEARMRQPQNRSVLDRSQFLNAVFARKSFSWTAVMMDLERVLPAGVQVTSIDPAISKEGDVSIRLRVSGDRNQAVLLVRNLETSQRFVAPRLAGEQSLATEGNHGGGAVVMPPGSVIFEILSGYNPLPEKQAKDVALVKTAEESGGDSQDEEDVPAAKTAKTVVSKHAVKKAKVAPVAKGGAR